VTRPRDGEAGRAISVRLSPAEITAIDEAAAADGLGRADWIRAVCRLARDSEDLRRRLREASELVRRSA
jgi:predicted DNA binding CopG/RHH family protein